MPSETRSEAEKMAGCIGCRNDFYNDKNPLGVKRCWSLENAQIVERYQIGHWTPQDRVEAFTKVNVYDCYHQPGEFAYYAELPEHLRVSHAGCEHDWVMPELRFSTDLCEKQPVACSRCGKRRAWRKGERYAVSLARDPHTGGTANA